MLQINVPISHFGPGKISFVGQFELITEPMFFVHSRLQSRKISMYLHLFANQNSILIKYNRGSFTTLRCNNKKSKRIINKALFVQKRFGFLDHLIHI